MRSTAWYWTLLALGALAVAATGNDVALVSEHSVAVLIPQPALLVVAGVLGMVVAGSAALMAGASTARTSAVAAGSLSALALALLLLSAELLAFLGYLPLALVLAPFDAEMRESFLAALSVSLGAQLLVVVGVVLWGAAVRRHLRTHPAALPGWARPEAAARWGRVAVALAVVPPLTYALTRFVWLFYPLGFDRGAWEAAQDAGTLLPGVWLGSFAVLGAVLTLGLVQRWGETFPRWVPGLAGRRVPVAAAVVPASLVAVVLVPAGISMIRQILTQEAGFDFISDWAAFGPTFLWPLWGLALGAATLAYALRRRGEQQVTGSRQRSAGSARRR